MALPGLHLVCAGGLYAARQRGRLAPCRAHRSGPPLLAAPSARPLFPNTSRDPGEPCPVCQHPLVLTQALPRGSLPPPAPRLAAAG